MIGEPRLNELYQEVILDHNKNPRNFKKPGAVTQYSHGVNPFCGDDYHLYLCVDKEGVIRDVGFEGDGCAISKSSASMMTAMIKGKRIEEVIRLKDGFLALMTKENAGAPDTAEIGRLRIFEGVKAFPIRVKCATLIWQALQDALNDVPS